MSKFFSIATKDTLDLQRDYEILSINKDDINGVKWDLVDDEDNVYHLVIINNHGYSHIPKTIQIIDKTPAYYALIAYIMQGE